MPTPFPGMDPYLERPDLWPDVHNRLIVMIADDLAPRLRPRYYVAIEERTYTLFDPGELVFAGRADVAVVPSSSQAVEQPEAKNLALPTTVTVELPMPDAVRESYLEVRAVDHNRVVTVLEVLSPTNKRPGEGREQYLRKRMQVLATRTHLVEIDLLRIGEPMPMRGDTPPGHYHILISREDKRPRADLISFSVRQPVPSFRLPLQPGDAEPLVELNRLLSSLYDRAGYDLRINYQTDPAPPLTGEDAAWADAVLRESGVRQQS